MIFYDKSSFGLGETPPLLEKKSKQISVFSVKEILDLARPPPPLSGKIKKTVFFMPPLRGPTCQGVLGLVSPL